MMTTFIEKIVGDLGDKRRWRQYRARVKALPTNYRTTVEALERDRSVTAIEREIHKEIEHGINKERGRLVKAMELAEAQDGATRS